MSHEHTPTRMGLGITCALIAYVFFVTASSLVRTVPKIPTIEILFFQNIVSLLFITPIAIRNGVQQLKTPVLSTHMIRDVVGVASYYLYFAAISALGLADATTLNYTAPFFIPLFWWLWMKERIHNRIWWSVILGFIGTATVLNPSKHIFQEGFVLGLFAGITSAIASVALRILNLKREAMSRTLFYYFLTGTILTSTVVWVYWKTPHGLEWVQLIGIGLSTVIAQMLLTVAYRYGTASFLSPIAYSAVIYAALVSVLIFDQPMTWRSIIGTVLIVIAGSFAYILKQKPHTIRETFEIPNPTKKPPL